MSYAPTSPTPQLKRVKLFNFDMSTDKFCVKYIVLAVNELHRKNPFSTEDNNGRGIPGISIEVYHLIKCKTPPESTSYIIRCENIHFVDLAKNLQKRIVALTEMYAKQFKVKTWLACVQSQKLDQSVIHAYTNRVAYISNM